MESMEVVRSTVKVYIYTSYSPFHEPFGIHLVPMLPADLRLGHELCVEHALLAVLNHISAGGYPVGWVAAGG